jgi:hypothetical protein
LTTFTEHHLDSRDRTFGAAAAVGSVPRRPFAVDAAALAVVRVGAHRDRGAAAAVRIEPRKVREARRVRKDRRWGKDCAEKVRT